MSSLTHLIAAEWLKLTRRPLAWVLLVLFLALFVLYLTLWFLVIALHEGIFSGGATRFEVLAPAQLAQLKLQLSLPGVFGTVLGQFNSSGGIFAIILAAAAIGSDYHWGTLRTLLVRAPSRRLYLLAKLISLMLALAAALLITLVVGSLLALLFSRILGLPGIVAPRDLLLLPLGIGRALYVVLPYVLLTIASAVFGRSVIAGVGGGLTFLALDVSAGSLGSLGAIDDMLLVAVNLLLQPNINTMVVLNSKLYGLDQSVLASSLDLSLLPPPWHATLVIAVYCVLFFFGAMRLIEARDVGGAS
jgi:ABC-2 type transport system permease protein